MSAPPPHPFTPSNSNKDDDGSNPQQQKPPLPPIVRFSEFLGMGYFGDERQHVIAPIFDSRHNAEKGWTRVMGQEGGRWQQGSGNSSSNNNGRIFHAIFVEHPSKYEFIAYPLEMDAGRINYVLYRSFSSLSSLRTFKETYGGRTFIKFGWHDLTRPSKFDVMPSYAHVDAVEFLKVEEVKQGTLADRIRKNELL